MRGLAAPSPKAPVMADVARLAGVSNQTVSRVINGSPNIRPQTRIRVQQAIERLGYRPNTAARALVRGRTGAIGIITSGSGFFGPSSIQRTIEEAARGSGLVHNSISMPTFTSPLLTSSVDHLLHQLVEGIIIVAGEDEAVALARSRMVSVPVVVVEGDLTRADWTVGVDQVAGARMVTRHLLDLGHRDIMHVAGPANWSEARARRDTWRAEMTAAGLRPLEPISGDWTAASGFAAGQQVATVPGVTAVFAANDQMAIGLLRALHEAGHRVPEDISVVGFDDLPETAYLIPPLTTVRQDFVGVGRKAIELLLSAMAGSEPTHPDLLVPGLVIRASSQSVH